MSCGTELLGFVKTENNQAIIKENQHGTASLDRNPSPDLAEDNAFFPSPYSLSQYTASKTDLDGTDYPTPAILGIKKS